MRKVKWTQQVHVWAYVHRHMYIHVTIVIKEFINLGVGKEGLEESGA